MLVNNAVQIAVLVAAMLWESRTDAGTTSAVKLCGRKLSDIMSRVCHAYNSPWSDPTVIEQPAAVVRRRRQTSIGIADECCTFGCTWDQLNQYCAISASSDSPLDEMEAHMIADRSAEGQPVGAVSSPAVMGRAARGEIPGARAEIPGARREVGRARNRGYGSERARGRRCWCKRKRRSGRRRTSFMGNTGVLKHAVRAAPVVGTVSPLLTWGRTLDTDLPPVERDRYAYVAIYT